LAPSTTIFQAAPCCVAKSRSRSTMRCVPEAAGSGMVCTMCLRVVVISPCRRSLPDVSCAHIPLRQRPTRPARSPCFLPNEPLVRMKTGTLRALPRLGFVHGIVGRLYHGSQKALNCSSFRPFLTQYFDFCAQAGQAAGAVRPQGDAPTRRPIP
jgi:hypothetical protein